MKKRSISFLLAVLCVCTVVFGCSKKSGGEESRGQAREKYVFTDGVHVLTAPETDAYMVENGKSDYKILLPKGADSNLIVAESELRYFFEQATGVKLGTVEEPASGMEHTAQGKYISLGATQMLLSSGIDIGANALGSQGARIITKDKTVYVCGATSNGALNAVYTLLQILFDYEQYSYDCFTVTETNNLKLRNFDVTDVPDIEMRGCPTTLLESNPNNLQYRFRLQTYSDFFMPIGDTENGESPHIVHNTSNVIPRNAPTSRNTWFSDRSGQGGDNTQLCYTAHGSLEDYEALIERAAYVIERSLIKYPPKTYPLRNIVAFTHEDNENTMCNCSTCTAAHTKYGTQSSLAIIVANDIRAKLEEWMDLPENAQYKREDLRLVFFAYAAFVDAPAHYDEQAGKYVVNHPDLVMRDDVGVFYAISRGLSYQQNLYDDASQEGVENSMKWFDISPSVYLWTYDANFGNYMLRTAGTNFYDTDAYQFFAAGGAKFMFKQSVLPGANVTSFQSLDMYLDAKMQWDTTQDIGELSERWFKAMFREAADPMHDLYVQENTRAIIVANETRQIMRTGIINYSIGREYWPYEMLKGWLNKIDEARAAIRKYELGNPSLYKMIKEHIDIEWVCPAYYMLAYNDDSLSNETYNEMVTYFKTDIAAIRDFQFSEKTTTMVSAWAAELTLR